jgi:hypothetical protein
MTKATSNCPNCGHAADGHFCANCGALLAPKAACGSCGKPLVSGAHYCHSCGAGVSRGSSGMQPMAAAKIQWAWIVPGIAVMAVVAFLIGQRIAAPAAAEGERTPLGAPMAGPFSGGAGGNAGGAPDISNMTPQERANRLFDRVMRYGEQGKQDSARIFAPMAIQAYEMLGTPDNHMRYDIGMVAVVSGDAAMAKAQSDTILKSSPTHLLGLIVAMKAAGLSNKTAERAALQKRFLAAKTSELAKPLPEYVDHRADIDAAAKSSGTP